jgi:pimeloyl-ACP methyl ester carboxylesterase
MDMWMAIAFDYGMKKLDQGPKYQFMQPEIQRPLEQTMPNLRSKVLLPGAGHWIQQERPSEVNGLILDFLKTL